MVTERLEDSLKGTASTTGTQVDFDKVLHLFTSSQSSELHERHAAAVNRLCASNTGGFLVRDLPKVKQILDLSLALLTKGSYQLLEPVIVLVRGLSKPFIRKTATDEVKALAYIPDLLSSLGLVFSARLESTLQMQCIQTLGIFAGAYGRRPDILAVKAAPAEGDDVLTGPYREYYTHQSILARSGIAGPLVQATACACLQQDNTLLAALLDLLVLISHHADTAVQLISAGILPCLAAVLTRPFRDPLVGPAVQLLWNATDYARATLAAALPVPAPSLEHITQGLGHGSTAVLEPSHSAVSSAAPSQRLEMDPPLGAHLPPLQGQASRERVGSAGVHFRPSNGSVDGAGLQTSPVERPGAGAIGTAPAGTPDMAGFGSVLEPLAMALSNLLCTMLVSGYAAADKELRNDVLSVIDLLLDVPGFIESSVAAGTFAAVLAAGTCPEHGNHPDLVQPFVLTTEDVDFELRLLTWCVCAKGCAHPDVLAQALAAGLLRVWLMYVSPPDGQPAVRRWSPDNLSTLRSNALSHLHSVTPSCFNEYEQEGGMSVLASFLSSPSAPVHTEAALRHLHKLLTCVRQAQDSAAAAGVIQLLTMYVADAPSYTDAVVHFAVLCLSALCVNHADSRARFRRADGVAAMLGMLARVHAIDPLMPSPLSVAVLECVWTCVVPDRKSAARFVVGEGVDWLLSLLDTGNRAHRPVILSMLADILEEPKARPFLHEWRSNVDKRTAATLLLSIWSEEDALRGISEDGVLTNIMHPLTGLDRQTKWVPQETVACANASPSKQQTLSAMLKTASGEGILAKVYAVFKVCGFDAFPDLGAQDRAVLCVVEKYVKFKQGEVWQAVQDEFQATGLRPTAPDRERLASGIELAQSLALAVQDAQMAILGRQQDTLRTAERRAFEDMQAQQRLEREMRFLGKDKSVMTLKELRDAKSKKENMLKDSMATFVFQNALTPEELASAGR